MEIILIIGVFVLPAAGIFWAFKKRKRLFYNMHFSSETIWMNFQNKPKRDAMELIQYQKTEAEEDEDGAERNDSPDLQ